MENKEPSISTHKTTIDKEVVLRFLQSSVGGQIEELTFINGGEGSQAFSFQTEGQNFILRINRHSTEGLRKDKYAFEHFHSENIPIPEITEIGKMENGYSFAISKKAEGDTIKNLSEKERDNAMPDLLNTLDSIHAVDVSNQVGYGKWNRDGAGAYSTWHDTMLDVDKYAKDLFDKSFLEKDVWEKIHGRFLELVPFCSEEKNLIHGDYGFDNVLAKNGEITGVIDWESSMYGDFVYDTAWLSFWSNTYDYETKYLEHRNLKDTDIPNWKERLLCYKLFIGLGSLSFYAYSNQKEKYELSKKKLLSLVN